MSASLTSLVPVATKWKKGTMRAKRDQRDCPPGDNYAKIDS